MKTKMVLHCIKIYLNQNECFYKTQRNFKTHIELNNFLLQLQDVLLSKGFFLENIF